ncbi:MAG: hypothetical protein KBT47_07390, partial [Armatimonadetes bacterium]|nr:hypothetical protein [Candidatus Hippobium faecium]
CYIASAGTGAFAYYMNTENRFYFEGMGPNLGDYGSGFRIGHKAVRAVSVNEWGEEFKTSLAPIINKKILGKETNSYGQDLVNIFFDLPERNYVAALAEPVVQEAEKGDRIAKEILTEEAKLFGRTVCVLVKNVRPCKEKLPIICSGSIFKSNLYKETFVQYVKEKIDNPIIFCSFSLVYGYIMNSVLGENSLDKNEYYEKLKNNAGKFRFQ